jgi:hypothetical protein
VNDPGVRAELRAALGYCAVHGAQWLGLHNALGLAIIYQDVCARVGQVLSAEGGTAAPPKEGTAGLLDKLEHLMGTGTSGTQAGRALAQALEPEGPCPACRHLVQVETQAVAACATALSQPGFREVYTQHPLGICLPHFRAVVAQLSDPTVLQAVVQTQAAHFRQTHAELGEVIRKFDYRYQDEARGPEFQAPGRSVEQAAGRLPTQLNLPHAAQQPT